MKDGPGVTVRLLLLDLVSRVVTGPRPSSVEREVLREQMRLLGFRRTVRGHILRGMCDGDGTRGGPMILAPALGGLFSMAVDAADLVVGHDILATGSWEPHIVAFYTRFLRSGMTVVDVGANIGFHALHAGYRVGHEGRVLAFEP